MAAASCAEGPLPPGLGAMPQDPGRVPGRGSLCLSGRVLSERTLPKLQGLLVSLSPTVSLAEEVATAGPRASDLRGTTVQPAEGTSALN